jgi:cardiolipin-specific phospholipase
MGLSQFFPKIYALDQLGWGLSSRPSFQALIENSSEDSVQTTEDFFVESLEAWRKQNNIDSMILAGHSMGGYISVAYTERYPQHVDRLILISPMGVPEETPAMLKKVEERFKGSFRYRLYEGLFPRYTAGDFLRTVPERTGRNWIGQYITRRLPVITDTDEQQILADYLYLNSSLPGSGEYCLPKLLKPSVVGRKPLQNRIPALKVKSCSFLYGESDWMDANGGLLVEQACAQQKLLGERVPDIDVYQVSKAGHLLMLENYEEFNNGLVMAVYGDDGHTLVKDAPVPVRLQPNHQRHATAPVSQRPQPSEGYSEAEAVV